MDVAGARGINLSTAARSACGQHDHIGGHNLAWLAGYVYPSAIYSILAVKLHSQDDDVVDSGRIEFEQLS